MPAVRLLSKTRIEAWLKTAATGKALHDGGGLYLRARGANAYWYLRQTSTLTGARTWAPLFPPGPGAAWPVRGLEEARAAADAAKKTADGPGGQDLVRARQAQSEDLQRAAEAKRLQEERRISVRTLFDRWRQTALLPSEGADGQRVGRKDEGAYTEAQFRRYVFPKLGDRAAVDVTKADLMAILDGAKTAGKRRTANVLLADLKQMFNFAAVRDIVPVNPLAAVRREHAGGKDGERKRHLSEDELRALPGVLSAAGLTGTSEAAVWLILATACRVGEAMAARWEHVDLDARTWLIPDTKNQHPHLVHLNDFAVRQFWRLWELDAERVAIARREFNSETRRTLRKDEGLPLAEAKERAAEVDFSAYAATQRSEWVFPNARNTGPVCVKSFGKQLADRQRDKPPMKRRAASTGALALPGGKWTPHDLRRTAATILGEAGALVDDIELVLNHTLAGRSKVAGVYIRGDRRARLVPAFELLGRELQRILDARPAVARPALALVA